MFGVIIHPQSVWRRRAVAELSVSGAQVQAIGVGHVLVVSNSGTGLPGFTSKVREPAIVVKYRLREYLHVLADFAPIEYQRRARLSGKQTSSKAKVASWPIKVMLVIVGSVAFFYKVNKVGTCYFKIDQHGVERRSKGGVLSTTWAEVVSVQKLGGAYLVQKAAGAMPIPFRCMSELQRTELERLAGIKLLEAPSRET